MVSSPTRNRVLRPTAAMLLACLLCLQCHELSLETVSVIDARVGASTAGFSSPHSLSDIAELAADDPVSFLHHCRRQYDFSDYKCTFTKKELVGNKLTASQGITVRCREEPFSVDMEWIRNPAQAKRALYVKNAWIDEDGRELAWIKPAGAIIKLFVPKIKQPIAGRRAKAASRRTLDQFGFKNTLDLIIKYVERGLENGVLELRYVGEGSVEGRPTFVFERFLPYTGQEEPYPDGLLRYHIDQEWLVPSACFSYADQDGHQLLGSYVITDVQFNVGLDDDDFAPDKIGF